MPPLGALVAGVDDVRSAVGQSLKDHLKSWANNCVDGSGRLRVSSCISDGRPAIRSSCKIKGHMQIALQRYPYVADWGRLVVRSS